MIEQLTITAHDTRLRTRIEERMKTGINLREQARTEHDRATGHAYFLRAYADLIRLDAAEAFEAAVASAKVFRDLAADICPHPVRVGDRHQKCGMCGCDLCSPWPQGS